MAGHLSHPNISSQYTNIILFLSSFADPSQYAKSVLGLVTLLNIATANPDGLNMDHQSQSMAIAERRHFGRFFIVNIFTMKERIRRRIEASVYVGFTEHPNEP